MSSRSRTGDRRTTWIRREPDDGETLMAGALALAAGAAVGSAVFYLARMFVSREVVYLDAVPVEEDPRG